MRASRALPFSLLPLLSLPTPTLTCRVTPLLNLRDTSQCSLYSTTSQVTPTFSYRLAASYTGKGQRFDPKLDTYTFNPLSLRSRFTSPSKSHRPNSGQDAFFIASVGPSASPENKDQNGNPHPQPLAFGVADGVGGWTESGVDPADFSHGLCRYMKEYAQNYTSPPTKSPLLPGSLIRSAYDTVTKDPSIHAGGSTAVVAVASPNGSVEVANLGDSGFVQLRPGNIQYASEPQIHAFNTPYQLSLIPAEMMERSKAFGGEPLHDYPEDAAVSRHDVRHGDVFVFASDGVWDNLTPGDVLYVIEKVMGQRGLGGWGNLLDHGGLAGQTEVGREGSLQEKLAAAVAGEAKAASMDGKRDGPFAMEVRRYYPGEEWSGGKVDDICVVVGVVVEV